MPKRPDPALETRIRANCGTITGLTPAELEEHIQGIVQVILEARLRAVG